MNDRYDDENENSDNGRIALLQKRLDAALNQVKELEVSISAANERCIDAESKAEATELKVSNLETLESTKPSYEHSPNPTDRDLRIKMADTARGNRDLQRQNDTLKDRVQDMIAIKEQAATSDRRVQQLEKELQTVTQKIEEGAETQRQWMVFRNEIIQEGLLEGEEVVSFGSSAPPEVSTVIRRIKEFKRNAKQQQEEISRVASLSGAHSRRCKVLETQLNEKSTSITLLEKKVKEVESNASKLDLENRKIIAQRQIWKRESDGMRALLDTYEQQETSKNSPTKKNNTDGLQLSLNSARDEIKLLSQANRKFEGTVELIQMEVKAAKMENERVLDKFGKLRNALMEERSKAESAEARACQAETLAGKGSYSTETTKVLHLKSNPLTEAIRDKFQSEIDSLRRQLEEVQSKDTITPATKSRTSFGSAGSKDSAVDVQKLHSRLKEQFRNQIALFRQGVYLITGYKIDMQLGENDTQIFTLRSIYGEREEDHLVFSWNPKRKSKLDMLDSEMAQVLMKGPCGVYVKDHGSWPGFMASVTLHLFDQQTVLSMQT